MEELFGDTNPFSDFFTTFFGGDARQAPRGTRRAQRAGRDVEHEIELTLEDAYHGTTRRLSTEARRLRCGPWTCAFQPA